MRLSDRGGCLLTLGAAALAGSACLAAECLLAWAVGYVAAGLFDRPLPFAPTLVGLLLLQALAAASWAAGCGCRCR